MAKMIKFPSIEQLRNVAHSVRHHSTYVGKDGDGNPVYDSLLPIPTITFTGTVKLHGTNAGVSYNVTTGEMWCQSRENIITPLKDNAGFAFHVEQNKDAYQSLLSFLGEANSVPKDSIITLYGEWCGQGIQKGVAISEIPKMMVVFGAKVTLAEEDKPAYWVSIQGVALPDRRIFNILDFPQYSIDIDFSKTEYVLPKLSELTIQVEEACPVAAVFGIAGIGEGIVWSAEYKGNRYMFKTKGEKHSKSKVKTVNVTHSTEKLDTISRVVEQVTPPWRLEQGLTETFDLNNGGQLDIKRMGDFLGWVMRDIVKEEMDVLTANNISPKEIGKYVSDVSRRYFLEEYNKV